jgi:hypothetical protein
MKIDRAAIRLKFDQHSSDIEKYSNDCCVFWICLDEVTHRRLGGLSPILLPIAG